MQGFGGSTPGQGTKIPCASQPKKQNIKQKQYCNKFKKDFKNGPYQKILKKNKQGNVEKEADRILLFIKTLGCK